MHALSKKLTKLPNGNPRLLIKALLQMTMETDDATERNRAPITPNWKLDISPILLKSDLPKKKKKKKQKKKGKTKKEYERCHAIFLASMCLEPIYK
jgi:hypothetical protein